MENSTQKLIKKEIAFTEKGIQLNTFEDLFRFSQAVAASGLAPKNMQKAETIMIAIQFGFEIGLTPMSALQNIAVINGVPTIYGDCAKALVLASEVCEYVKEYTSGSIDENTLTANCISKRKNGEELASSFSIKDAKLAGLWNNSPTWKKYPTRMLMFRARGFNLRDNFADILKGIKTAEEVSDYVSGDVVSSKSKKEIVSEPPTLEISAVETNDIVDVPQQPEQENGSLINQADEEIVDIPQEVIDENKEEKDEQVEAYNENFAPEDEQESNEKTLFNDDTPPEEDLISDEEEKEIKSKQQNRETDIEW